MIEAKFYVPIAAKGKYKCSYCKNEFTSKEERDKCESAHEEMDAANKEKAAARTELDAAFEQLLQTIKRLTSDAEKFVNLKKKHELKLNIEQQMRFRDSIYKTLNIIEKEVDLI